MTRAESVSADYNGREGAILRDIDRNVIKCKLTQDWSEGKTIATFDDGSRLVFSDFDVIVIQAEVGQ